MNTSNHRKVLVTGGSGFLGSYLIPYLQETHLIESISLRKNSMNDIDFSNTDVIVHLAGMAHQMKNSKSTEYFEINRDLTQALAEKAKKDAVSHFIFISTVKVYGENEIKFDENSPCTPSDDYGRSKLEAEQILENLRSDKFKVSIIRPPLIYGPHVKGNLDRITKMIKKRKFSPFGGIQNHRSMVFVGNISALIKHLIDKPQNGIFIAGDRDTYSTTELVQEISKNLKNGHVIISIPLFIRKLISFLKPNFYKRIFSDFVIDNSSTNKKLAFEPPYSFELGIKTMVDSFKEIT